MDFLFRRLVHCALHPVQGFQERAAHSPKLGVSFGWMLLLRGSISLIGSSSSSTRCTGTTRRSKIPTAACGSRFCSYFLPRSMSRMFRAFVTSLPNCPPRAVLGPGPERWPPWESPAPGCTTRSGTTCRFGCWVSPKPQNPSLLNALSENWK